MQKDLIRHANIGATMNVYGAALPEEQRRANSAVVEWWFTEKLGEGPQVDRRWTAKGS